MKKVDIVLVGARGRMGGCIQSLIKESTQWDFLAGYDREPSGSKIHSDFAEIKFSERSVVIDFSLPDNFDQVMDWCLENRRPLVSGTTGLTEGHFKKMKSVSQRIPIFWAPNMSFGIALFGELIKSFGAAKDIFEFQIEEVHHNKKLDSPSGTAKYLQQELVAVLDQDVPPPLAIRGGGVFGIHKLWAMAEEETLTIEHNALDRKVFARGALRAASWLIEQAPGQYSMGDLVRAAKS